MSRNPVAGPGSEVARAHCNAERLENFRDIEAGAVSCSRGDAHPGNRPTVYQQLAETVSRKPPMALATFAQAPAYPTGRAVLIAFDPWCASKL